MVIYWFQASGIVISSASSGLRGKPETAEILGHSLTILSFFRVEILSCRIYNAQTNLSPSQLKNKYTMQDYAENVA